MKNRTMMFVTMLVSSLAARAGQVVLTLDLSPSPRTPTASETITYDPAWSGGSSVTLALDGEIIGKYSTAGTCALDTTGWLRGHHTLTHTSGGETLTARFVLPDVTNVSVQQRYPWNGLVDIDFTVDGVSEDNMTYIGMEMSFRRADEPPANGVRFATGTAAVMTQTWWSNGTYRVTWDAEAQLGTTGLVYSNLVVDVAISERTKGVQLWEDGPYWAECNVGAIRPEEYGTYFWWGDTVGYKRNASDTGWVSVADGSSFSFTEGNCPTYNKSDSELQSAGYIGSTGNLVAEHDAATAHLGAPWRMPTKAEWAALIQNCDTTWTTRNGVYGRLVTGRGAYASKSIFLPAAGGGVDSDLYYLGSDGGYWSSTSGSLPDCACLSFDSGYIYRNSYCDRYYGLSVRPLRGWGYTVTFNANGGTGTMPNESFTYGTAKALTANVFTRTGYAFAGWATSATATSAAYADKASVINLTSTANGTVNLYAVWEEEEVQLWEDGPYWARCNVGASQPEDFGYYFWWGDTVGYKRNADDTGWVSVANGSSFSFDDCPTYNKSASGLHSAGYIDSTGNLAAAHDAATAHLGAPWRMPTDAEWAALISNCTTKWTTRNGVYGRLVKGRGAYASKSIFLPAAGYGDDSDLSNPGSYGYYWSSTLSPSYGAWYLYFSSGDIRRRNDGLDSGQSVRPVRGFAQ